MWDVILVILPFAVAVVILVFSICKISSECARAEELERELGLRDDEM